MTAKELIESKALEIYIICWDNLSPSDRPNVIQAFNKMTFRYQKKYFALAKHVLACELKGRIETQKEFNNPVLTCNCLNHSNRRIKELQSQLQAIEEA